MINLIVHVLVLMYLDQSFISSKKEKNAMIDSILRHVLVVKKCKDPVKMAVQHLFI